MSIDPTTDLFIILGALLVALPLWALLAVMDDINAKLGRLTTTAASPEADDAVREDSR